MAWRDKIPGSETGAFDRDVVVFFAACLGREVATMAPTLTLGWFKAEDASDNLAACQLRECNDRRF
jgi:hypothetical protein